MCGITGIYTFEPQQAELLGKAKASVATLNLRGPEFSAVHTEEKVALGHARLSIIDLSTAANQPMQDVTGRYTIVFNGEIYNYRPLREQLIKKGLPLKTNSDTETLLYLYIIEGEKCLEKLHGFFAFAVYDNKEDELFIARDRMGIKPLVFYRCRGFLAFASEMKALLEYPVPRTIDQTSLNQYFQFNYIPSPFTIFENVEKLSPGQFLKIKKGKLEHGVYYSIPYNRSRLITDGYDGVQENIRHLLEESVKERMISDVPLGAFLSGGIDSSVIVAEASKFTNNLNTFSIGYKDEPYFDETHYAALVAEKFKTNHTVFKLSNNDLFEHLDNVLDYIDEPFADSSALAVYILSKHTRKKVTVALSGDGADELFSGYNKHMAHYRALYKGGATGLVKNGLPLWRTLPKSRNGKFSNLFRQLERFGTGLTLGPQDRYWMWASLLSEDNATCLLAKRSSLQELKQRKNQITKHILNAESINDILFTDMQLVLVSDMLHKVDSMSMANSLEVRTPFLDHRLVDYVFSLDEKFKISPKMKKKVLQDAYRNVLPPELYKRPKHGFEVPLLKWFQGEFNEKLKKEYLNADFIQEQGVFNQSWINNCLQKLHSSNPGDVHANIWALTVFQHWWKKYMA
jgi:asparagine synthase (glutamine-hydrolysing)